MCVYWTGLETGSVCVCIYEAEITAMNSTGLVEV